MAALVEWFSTTGCEPVKISSILIRRPKIVRVVQCIGRCGPNAEVRVRFPARAPSSGLSPK